MKREALEHSKLHVLAAELAKRGVPERWSLLVANGVLERMWVFASKYVPDGGVDPATAAQMARVIGWPMRSILLIEALRVPPFLDVIGDKYFIHDWPKHCDRWVHRKLIRCGKTFADGTQPKEYHADRTERGLPAGLPGAHPYPGPGIPGPKDLPSGAKPLNADPLKALFDTGVGLLTRHGATERNARSLVGRLRKHHRQDGKVLELLTRATTQADPQAWLAATLTSPTDRPYVPGGYRE